MTIFGFNTDVRHGETIYHVQSEARPSDLLVQTLVFLKGQCVGKRTVSYAQRAARPDFSDQAIHELLKLQHRTVVDAITGGNMESVLGTSEDVSDIGGSGLSLNWVKAEPTGGQSMITVHLQVTDSGQGVAGAHVISRAGTAADSQVIAQAVADPSGHVEMQIPLTEELRRESAITVQANHGQRSATRKFRFKKTEPKQNQQ
jgi:hypothetical protein